MKGGACLHAPPFGVSLVTPSQVSATTRPLKRRQTPSLTAGRRGQRGEDGAKGRAW